jgi:Chaperone of endosialidase
VSGKTSTSSSNVAIPPQVMAQYSAVTSQANQTATTPFSQYQGQFVAPTTAEQNTGIANTNTAADSYQPYYSAATGTLGGAQAATTPVNNLATGLAAASGEAVDPTQLTGDQINSYLSPYLGDVLGSTEALQNQSNQQQQAGQLGDAITSGAFGSDRTGIAAANLEEQQNLANNSTIANIANTGYTNAQQVAEQQQGVNLSAQQANRAALGTAATTLAGVGSTAYGEGANTASELGALGTGAQTAGLAGANAQIAAGTVQQQTEQAQDTAEYNQFLQQQSYPFQVGSWLAGISEGIGTNEGSTTTTTQPGGFFSDKRLKHDIKKIGKTYDGQTIYSYKMGDDPRTRIGLIAQEVEKKHPDAVGLAAGFKMVDYGKATDPAANRGHFREGGVVPMRRVARAYGGGTDLDAVLQAQQQMYSGLGGGNSQRQMPTQASGGHGLAVANAPAAAPQTGISQVNQGLGLVQKGQQLYGKFNPSTPAAAPAAPSGGGLAPAGAQSSGATTFAAPASPVAAPASSVGTAPATSGWITDPAVGGASDAATAGAGDVAASGATDAAAGAATDAAAGAAGDAAAGAATGAAAGAGAEAGADAAAALAAEYAAADVGTVALMAAKRGGRIHKDVGGGMPYSDDAGAYDIPNEAGADNSLKAAPAAGKQPTGLQTLMYMGDPNNTSSLMGSMFSNEALARGGVAGRGRFAGGGAADASDDPDADAAGLGSPDAPAGSADTGDSSTGLGAWFQKNKGYILPALSGLAAMGTAKTVHPGVALAAGLGAGVDSYLNTQASLAKTADVTAQAQGQQISNQMSQLGLRTAKSALAPGANSGLPTTPVRPQGMVSADPNDPQEQAFNQFAPLPTARPDAVTNKIFALKLIGKDSAADALGNQYDQQIAKINQTRAQGANAAYLSMTQIANAQQPGQAFALLQKANPTQAAQIQQAGGSPADMDQAAKTWAATKGLGAHQYSGRPTDMQNGVMLDSLLNAPVIGSDQVMTGLTGPEKAAAFNDWTSSVTLGNGLPGKKFQAYGYASPEAAILAQDRAARLTSSPSTASGPPTTPIPSAVPGAGTASGAPGPARTAGAPPNVARAAPRPAPAPAAPTAVPTSGDPYLDKALTGAVANPRYREPALPPVTDQLSRAAADKQQAMNIDNRQALLTDASKIASEQSTARQYLTAAKAIMDSKGAPTTGVPGAVRNWISSKFNGVDATNYQEVSKNLINAAVQQGHTNFPNATQSEFATQTSQMSPSTSMPPDAIKDLIGVGLRTSDYMLKSADRATLWAKTPGVDAMAFNDWNQKNYPREKLVNAQATATGKNGEKLYYVNGKWQP